MCYVRNLLQSQNEEVVDLQWNLVRHTFSWWISLHSVCVNPRSQIGTRCLMHFKCDTLLENNYHMVTGITLMWISLMLHLRIPSWTELSKIHYWTTGFFRFLNVNLNLIDHNMELKEIWIWMKRMGIYWKEFIGFNLNSLTQQIHARKLGVLIYYSKNSNRLSSLFVSTNFVDKNYRVIVKL